MCLHKIELVATGDAAVSEEGEREEQGRSAGRQVGQAQLPPPAPAPPPPQQWSLFALGLPNAA